MIDAAESPPGAPLLAIGLDGAPAGWVAALLYADAHTPEPARTWITRTTLIAHVNELTSLPRSRTTRGRDRHADRAARLRRAARVRRRRTLAAGQARQLRVRAAGPLHAGRRRRLRGDPRAGGATPAHRTNAKSLSAQAAGIAPKVAEVDGFVRAHPDSEGWLWECHPELSFQECDGGRPLHGDKRSAAGLVNRLALAREAFPDLEQQLRAAPWAARRVTLADALDAYAALSTAVRCARGEQLELADGTRDREGLLMRIAV